MSDAQRARHGALWVAAAALIWSTGGLFIKLAPMSGLAVACGRSAVTAIFYLAVLRPNLRRASWITAISYAAMTISFVSATKLTTAANAIFLQYTGPAYVLLLAPFLLGEKLRRIDVSSVLLSLAGLSLFFVGKVEAGQAAGNVLGAVSGIFFGLTILFLRRDARGSGSGDGDAVPSTTLGNLLAAVLVAPFAAPALLDSFRAPGHPPLITLGVLLWLGVVQMGVAYLLFARGLKSVPASEASLLSMLEPLFSPLWVFLGTGERPGGWALLGGVVVLAAVLLRALAPDPPPTP